jgi:hypothetical protein
MTNHGEVTAARADVAFVFGACQFQFTLGIYPSGFRRRQLNAVLIGAHVKVLAGLFRPAAHVRWHISAGEVAFPFSLGQCAHEHPVVLPHVSHFKHVPFRTSVKLPQDSQASPS